MGNTCIYTINQTKPKKFITPCTKIVDQQFPVFNLIKPRMTPYTAPAKTFVITAKQSPDIILGTIYPTCHTANRIIFNA
ncbi:hypothetical protein CSTERTH_09220 [Thermoclostridium stercorarium subsp. thermolacticum DSM 2910]|jgi:hypothetical protein|uniref:Uncharacterized protein n=1 Tax=Thermoclostridium stercorarium subsp. thermolacticum DSM 2910 TaxID=1121336 RepID=A0A1B1YEK9_THEST|nr:hypothetical protein CSTERTH_09220 [Thermoclostridium stercorarium subsp. thermolacticum DSM 2910]